MEDSYIEVVVVEARNLKPMDSSGTSDPYCILRMGEQEVLTKPQRNTLNPIWEETFTFPIKAASDVLEIIVMDKDFGEDDDFEGQCMVSLDSLYDQQKIDNWFNLQGETPMEKWQGKLRLQLQWFRSDLERYKDRLKYV